MKKILLIGIMAIFISSMTQIVSAAKGGNPPKDGAVRSGAVMNKAELIEAIAEDANSSGASLSKADAKRALEGFIAAATSALKKGDRVALAGFGSFSVSNRAGGGRHTPFHNKYRPQLHSGATLEEGREMVMPGDNVNNTVPVEFSGDAGMSGNLNYGHITVLKRADHRGHVTVLKRADHRGHVTVLKRADHRGHVTVLKRVEFKAGDRPFLPNIEYTTTEDIIRAIITTSKGAVSGVDKGGLTEDQARQFINSFISVILDTVQKGVAVNVGEDFGTFGICLVNPHGNGPACGGETNRIEGGWDGTYKGKRTASSAKSVVKFKAGADLSKAVN